MNELLNYTLFQDGQFTIKVITLLNLFAFIVVTAIILKIAKKTIYRVEKIDIAKRYSIYNLVRYLIIVVAILTGLQLFGFNLSVLVAGSAALMVGVGLGLQNLFSDFVSGIILLVDSSVKVNDVIEADGLICIVKEINLRTTTVLTRDDKYIILPNSSLTSNQLINWTHNDLASRFEVHVGVDYASDVKQVMQVLKQAVDQQTGILKSPSPFVRFTDFGDSSLQFCIIFWSEDVFRVENIKSEMRIKIFELFKENKITIPFPQRVLHINK
ncbi:mechanosensitive ion channel family protein [Flavobacterium muglaense]|uniref:Mechanosensitive ion channel n=1 Tax=Flavobacterium muglaense TaxID=2764716 RepID=A0A923N135_9FLAO|nr:mechanosensitive ion channel domain-containing protein [Flavobacterium muglaense]MBC5838881.1 mechanosensitive ion channel [Flavobacterium muglaense]MBC5845379.1 mechanosensitive ion channel [Flavobacterium muglaense]